MTTMDITPLKDAIAQLAAGLREATQPGATELVRDGVIQRFEYSHELSLKFIRRALETVFGDPVDQMPYNDVLRIASERGLIDNIERWFTYRSARNKSSHTYDSGIAAEVFAAAITFLDDARILLRNLDALPHRSAD
jgi:nucleotidyltransferase substrate binding protein (TIGR01987 family)